MKLRIKGNSIRYRLNQSDVHTFLTTGSVTEETNFGNAALGYELRLTTAEDLSATLNNNKITVFMPKKMAETWNDPETIGFNGTYNNLHLLIEKDFQCIDNTLEDQSDNYPNPSSKC